MYIALSLQSIIAPICSYSENDKSSYIEQYFGTGFFFSTEGFFLTARHVIEKGFDDAKKNDLKLGIFPSIDDLTQELPTYSTLTMPIIDFEYAGPSYDIALCKTEYEVNTSLRLDNINVEVEQKVFSFGYFVYDLGEGSDNPTRSRLNKGHIEKFIPKNDPTYGNRINLFEPSFPLREGLSGSPLFTYFKGSKVAIGVCVDSYRLRNANYKTIVYNVENTGSENSDADLTKYFGVAQDIRPLLDWTPEILNGRTLADTSTDFLK